MIGQMHGINAPYGTSLAGGMCNQTQTICLNPNTLTRPQLVQAKRPLRQDLDMGRIGTLPTLRLRVRLAVLAGR
jgi:hypothetical protein